VRIPFCVCALALSQVLVQAEEPLPTFRAWKPYTGKEPAFKVKLPVNKGELQERQRAITLEGLRLNTQVVHFIPEDGPTLTITVFDFPADAPVRLKVEERLELLRNAVVMEVRGKLRQEHDITHQEKPGKFYEIAGTNGEVQLYHVAAGERVYQLMAYARPHILAKAGLEDFFKSLELPREDTAPAASPTDSGK
jgi:hypothetical protein